MRYLTEAIVGPCAGTGDRGPMDPGITYAGVPAGSLKIWLLSPLSPQVAQVAAKTLGIPLELVKVKPSNTLTNPNGQATGGSITSELNCLVSYMLYQRL